MPNSLIPYVIEHDPYKKLRHLIYDMHKVPAGIYDCGWGNGYVIIPEDNILYDYIECIDLSELDVSVHLVRIKNENERYITIAFDTAHSWNNSVTHNKKYVLKETFKLWVELKKLEKGYIEEKERIEYSIKIAHKSYKSYKSS